MGSKELIESLRQATEEQLRAIKEETEAEANKIRSDFAREIDQKRSHYAKMQSLEMREKTAKISLDGHDRARRIKLSAEKKISERLYSLSRTCLHRLRNEGYRNIFLALIRELPLLTWRTVIVNSEDKELAKECFPDAEIIADDTISGGVDVMTEAGEMRVSNNFEKRLERSWEDMLPAMLSALYDEVSNHGTPGET